MFKKKKERKKKAGHVVGKPLDSFKTLYEKDRANKLMQILFLTILDSQ